MIDGTRGLKTGDYVTVPAGTGRRPAVVEFVYLNGLSFIDTTGSHHFVRDAELVPLAGVAAEAGAA
jgi:hypothetical protein